MSALVPDPSGRTWPAEYVEAGFDTAAFGPVPSAKSKLLGRHVFQSGRTIVVEYMDKGPSGNPELRLEWGDGSAVTVVDEACAQAYLALEGPAA